MTIRTILAGSAALAASLTLAACGSADDASTEAEPDTVEMPANDALADVEETPVADPEATTPVAPTELTDEPTVSEREAIEEAGDEAAATAAAAADALVEE